MTFDKPQNFQPIPMTYSNGTIMLNATNATMVGF
jgi:hypothetical protein